MKHVGRAFVFIYFSLIFFIFFLLPGALIRALFDPLRLSKNKSSDESYLRLVIRPKRTPLQLPITDESVRKT